MKQGCNPTDCPPVCHKAATGLAAHSRSIRIPIMVEHAAGTGSFFFSLFPLSFFRRQRAGIHLPGDARIRLGIPQTQVRQTVTCNGPSRHLGLLWRPHQPPDRIVLRLRLWQHPRLSSTHSTLPFQSFYVPLRLLLAHPRLSFNDPHLIFIIVLTISYFQLVPIPRLGYLIFRLRIPPSSLYLSVPTGTPPVVQMVISLLFPILLLALAPVSCYNTYHLS